MKKFNAKLSIKIFDSIIVSAANAVKLRGLLGALTSLFQK